MVSEYYLLFFIYNAKLRGYFARNNPLQFASKKSKDLQNFTT